MTRSIGLPLFGVIACFVSALALYANSTIPRVASLASEERTIQLWELTFGTMSGGGGGAEKRYKLHVKFPQKISSDEDAEIHIRLLDFSPYLALLQSNVIRIGIASPTFKVVPEDPVDLTFVKGAEQLFLATPTQPGKKRKLRMEDGLVFKDISEDLQVDTIATSPDFIVPGHGDHSLRILEIDVLDPPEIFGLTKGSLSIISTIAGTLGVPALILFVVQRIVNRKRSTTTEAPRLIIPDSTASAEEKSLIARIARAIRRRA